MAQIENSYKEVVNSHTTEEVIAHVIRCLMDARLLSALDAETKTVTKEALMVAAVKSNVALDILVALAKKLDILDDTPTLV